MFHPLMKCGCVAQGLCSWHAGKEYDPPIPSCIIHDCIEIAEKQPDLTGRTARCAYFGSKKLRRSNDECKYGCCGKERCECGNVPSSYDLAFFEYHPEEKQDRFYCGCHGWN